MSVKKGYRERLIFICLFWYRIGSIGLVDKHDGIECEMNVEYEPVGQIAENRDFC